MRRVGVVPLRAAGTNRQGGGVWVLLAVLAAALSASLLLLMIVASPAKASHSQDFAISKTADQTAVAVGQNVTFTLNVSNTTGEDSSPAPAIVADQLPAGLQLVSFKVVQQPENVGPFTCSAIGNTVTCNSPYLFGVRGGTDTAVIEIVAMRTGSGEVTNTATIQPGFIGTDTNLANNTSSVTVGDATPQAKDKKKHHHKKKHHKKKHHKKNRGGGGGGIGQSSGQG